MRSPHAIKKKILRASARTNKCGQATSAAEKVRRQGKYFPPYRRSKLPCGRKKNIRGKPSGLSPKRKYSTEGRIFLDEIVRFC